MAVNSKMQPRAQIFIEKYGEWDSTEYKIWINENLRKYRKQKGLYDGQPFDQDDFTEFLRGEVK